MIIHVLDTTLNVIGIIEDYYSLTWAERYSMAGDFELELPISYDESSLVEFGNFLYIGDSDTIMIIEDIKPASGEGKTNLVVQGESAESLLKRRSLLYMANVGGLAENLFYYLMRVHITDPMWDSAPDREITIFKDSFPPAILPGVFEEQLERISIYEIADKICKVTGYGYKVIKEDNELAIYMYNGIDRSYDQSVNPFVIFSEKFDNVISSSFYLSEKGKVNIVLVITDDPVYSKFYVWKDGDSIVGGIEPSNLDRFEIVLETTIDRYLDEDNPLTNAEVLAILRTRAREIIEEKKTVGIFEGDFDIQGNFKYGVDFFMGDIVQCQIANRNVKARIIEMVRSYSAEGKKTYIALDFITT